MDLKPCPFCGTRLEPSAAFSSRLHPVMMHRPDVVCILADIRLSERQVERMALWNDRKESE